MTARARILVVDDEPVLRRTLERALTSLGYEVTVVADGASAYQLIMEESFGVVLVDVHMPQMAGDTLCVAVLRSRPELAGRLVIMTGDPWSAQQNWPPELQACPILAKPFGLELLERVVADALNTSQKRPRRRNGKG